MLNAESISWRFIDDLKFFNNQHFYMGNDEIICKKIHW